MQGFSIRTLECWLASWQGASLLQRGLSVGHVGKFPPARMPSLLGTALDNDTPKRSEEKMRAEDRTRQPGRAVDWAGKHSGLYDDHTGLFVCQETHFSTAGTRSAWEPAAWPPAWSSGMFAPHCWLSLRGTEEVNVEAKSKWGKYFSTSQGYIQNSSEKGVYPRAVAISWANSRCPGVFHICVHLYTRWRVSLKIIIVLRLTIDRALNCISWTADGCLEFSRSGSEVKRVRIGFHLNTLSPTSFTCPLLPSVMHSVFPWLGLW